MSESDNTRVIIVVSGRVQGVGFRYSTQQMARQMGLSGYVKNQADGTVYIEAQGPSAVILNFIHWCLSGPPHAEVESAEHTFHPVLDFSGFKILG
jgi:acylphosphatase